MTTFLGNPGSGNSPSGNSPSGNSPSGNNPSGNNPSGNLRDIKEQHFEEGTPYDVETRQRLEQDAKDIIARYPQTRSALLPMLHLVQSVDGRIT